MQRSQMHRRNEHILQQIQLQIEYYFSADNLPRDGYLQQILAAHNGVAPLLVLANFPKLQQLYRAGDVSETIEAIICRALEHSRLVTVSADRYCVFPVYNSATSPLPKEFHNTSFAYAVSPEVAQATAMANNKSSNDGSQNTVTTCTPTSFTTNGSAASYPPEIVDNGHTMQLPYFAPVYQPHQPAMAMPQYPIVHTPRPVPSQPSRPHQQNALQQHQQYNTLAYTPVASQPYQTNVGATAYYPQVYGYVPQPRQTYYYYQAPTVYGYGVHVPQGYVPDTTQYGLQYQNVVYQAPECHQADVAPVVSQKPSVAVQQDNSTIVTEGAGFPEHVYVQEQPPPPEPRSPNKRKSPSKNKGKHYIKRKAREAQQQEEQCTSSPSDGKSTASGNTNGSKKQSDGKSAATGNTNGSKKHTKPKTKEQHAIKDEQNDVKSASSGTSSGGKEQSKAKSKEQQVAKDGCIDAITQNDGKSASSGNGSGGKKRQKAKSKKQPVAEDECIDATQNDGKSASSGISYGSQKQTIRKAPKKKYVEAVMQQPKVAPSSHVADDKTAKPAAAPEVNRNDGKATDSDGSLESQMAKMAVNP